MFGQQDDGKAEGGAAGAPYVTAEPSGGVVGLSMKRQERTMLN